MEARDAQILRSMLRSLDAAFKESEHPRVSKGKAGGGEFTSGHGGGAIASKAQGNRHREAAAKSEKVIGSTAVKTIKNFPGKKHKNVVQLVGLADGSNAVFKPRSGSWRNSVKGRVVLDPEREVGTWELAKLMGLDDLVAPAVKRTINGEEGAIFAFQNGVQAAAAPKAKQYDGEEDLPRAAMFDYITGNNDRHGGNWLVDGDKLRLIDHDRAFPEWHKADQQALMDEAALRQKYKDGGWDDEPDIGPLADYAKPYIQNKGKILALLKAQGIPPKALSAVGRRIDRLSTMKDWTKLKFSPKDYE